MRTGCRQAPCLLPMYDPKRVSGTLMVNHNATSAMRVPRGTAPEDREKIKKKFKKLPKREGS